VWECLRAIPVELAPGLFQFNQILRKVEAVNTKVVVCHHAFREIICLLAVLLGHAGTPCTPVQGVKEYSGEDTSLS
jgi:hypothetical protein